MAPRKKKPNQQPPTTTTNTTVVVAENTRASRRKSIENLERLNQPGITVIVKDFDFPEVVKTPVKKVVKVKPVLLPTRPPSARRREKLQKMGIIGRKENTEGDITVDMKPQGTSSDDDKSEEADESESVILISSSEETGNEMETNTLTDTIETEATEISQKLENLAVNETETTTEEELIVIFEGDDTDLETNKDIIMEEESEIQNLELEINTSEEVIEDEDSSFNPPDHEVTVECITTTLEDDLQEDNSCSSIKEDDDFELIKEETQRFTNDVTIEEVLNNSEDSKTEDNIVFERDEIKSIIGVATTSKEEKPLKTKKKTPIKAAVSRDPRSPKTTPVSSSKKKEKVPKSAEKKKKTSATTNTTIEDENSVRRSSRIKIKTISDLKKTSKGRGVVKTKTDSDLSESSSNSGNTESEKSTPIVSPCSNNEPEQKKPVRKTRWQKANETDVSAFPLISSSSVNNSPTPVISHIPPLNKAKLVDEEVQSRLKQFVHLKENLYLTDRMTCKEAKKMVCDCFLTAEEVSRKELGCGEDCLNRLLMIECGNLCPIADRCTNKRFQKSQFAPVEVFKTDKKGLGLRAAANIPYGEFILEYIGEVLDPDEFEKRAEDYSKIKNLHYYFMSLRADAVIDATAKGNISRFINHSCDPNAETQKWTVNGELRIGFFSTRTILAGEEVTFDYRFQRYGKEAQKCFCGASLCRGWLGEEPDEEYEDEEDDEDEDEEEEEEEDEEEELETPQESTAVVTTQPEVQIKQDEETTVINEKIDLEEPTDENKIAAVSIDPSLLDLSLKETVPASPIKKEKKPKKEKEKKVKEARPKRRPRMDVLEDLDLDTEIDMLVTTGLKNQSHTLKLSRLIVRAKDPTQRAKLLRILRRGELPCRRLFLDYHGLRLIHGYMTDAQHLVKTDKKFESLRLELLQTLATLPIPNKTMLQDSKVLSTVEKWSTSGKGNDSPIDSESNSPKNQEDFSSPVQEPSRPIIKPEPPPAVVIKKEQQQQKPLIEDPESDSELYIRKSVGMTFETSKSKQVLNKSGQSLADEICESFELEFDNEIEKKVAREPQQNEPNYLEEIVALAIKLLEEWSNLKESFRIPKKERIEQMKLHEREANKRFFAGIGSDVDERRIDNRYRSQRYRTSDKRDSPLGMNKSMKTEDRYAMMRIKMSKHQRRNLFAMEVEAKEEDRRMKQRELWVQHEKHCMMLGTDPRFTAPFDPKRGYQCIWNPQIGQWQTIPLPPQIPNLYNTVSLPNTSIPPPQLGPSVPTYPYSVSALPNMQLTVPPIVQSIPIQSMPQIQTLQTLQQNLYVQQVSLPSILTAKPPPALPTNALQNVLNIQYQKEEKEDPSQVKFMGPIPPPVKLPPKWKCGKDKYGRPYYYHIKIRKSQWEPPPFILPVDEPEVAFFSDSSSSSDTSTFSSDSNSDDDSDDEIDDTKLLQEVRKQMEKQAKLVFKAGTAVPSHLVNEEIDTPSPADDSKASVDENEPTESFSKYSDFEGESSIDKRLKEQFNLLGDDKGTPPKKKRRTGLCQEILISPRTEEDRQQFKEDVKRYKQNKEDLKRQRELIIKHSKKAQVKEKLLKEKLVKEKLSKVTVKSTVKSKWKEMNHDNSENAKKIKETFRSSMANVVVCSLNVYRKPDCKEGRITNTEDFKHLARKLTHFVMLKEMKHISKLEELLCTDNVKSKAREYIKKYMAKFGETYQKRDDEPDNYY